ncbi:MAG: HTH-type transcriptional regulator DdrOC [Anaerolineae bacterium]|nr:HTH-type transcriptional regulator DdrOC [Anaerolineae bacterium]
MINRTRILGNFGKKLQDLRKKRGLTQEQLAEIAEFDRTYISMLERGARNPSLLNIYRLAEALKITPADLLEKS